MHPPTSHKFIATGLGKVRCATCGSAPNAPEHRQYEADLAGADYVRCPGCEGSFPLDMTVRMMQYKMPNGSMLGKTRVCRKCAGFETNPWVELARRFEAGTITEEAYVAELSRLSALPPPD